MPKPLGRLSKPAYVFRPDQLVRRLTYERAADDAVVVRLPWGLPLEVLKSEHMGAGIARAGVHELTVTEAMWRLADRSDVALDVGANVGYFTALLAARCRRVVAFEPHPMIRRGLEANVERWEGRGGRVSVDGRAVSESTGTARLGIPEHFAVNQGTASLEWGAVETIDVPTVALDEIVGETPVGILKLDVEGHEAAVLKGARRALSDGSIRDIFFEEHAPLPSEVSRLLEGDGYALFGITQRFRGPALVSAVSEKARPRWVAPTYLATREPGRAIARMRSRGWHSLRPRNA